MVVLADCLIVHHSVACFSLMFLLLLYSAEFGSSFESITLDVFFSVCLSKYFIFSYFTYFIYILYSWYYFILFYLSLDPC